MMLCVYVREVAKQHFFVNRRLSYFLDAFPVERGISMEKLEDYFKEKESATTK